MKTMFKFLTLIFCAALFTGCSKNDVPALTPEQQTAKYLTGGINRVWRLKKQYIKGVEQVLTNDQLQYTKTFTVDPTKKLIGGYTNSDGDYGEWIVTTGITFDLSFTTTGGFQYQYPYTIRDISDNLLDIQYTLNGQTTREVYYAY